MSEQDKYAGLPAQVRRDAEEVDRLEAEAAAGKTQEGTPENPAPSEAPDAKKTDDNAKGGKETPGKDPASGDFEQKYKVLRGKYDKEVPELNGKLRDLHIQNTDLQRRLSDLEAALAQKGAGDGQSGSEMSSESDGLNPGDYEEYGEEFVKLAEDNRRLRALVEEMRGDVQTVKKTAADTANQRFLSGLAELKPEWQEIDGDPAFDTWLYETGNKAGYVAAASEKNAQRCVDVMDLYILRTGKTYGNKEPSSPQANKDNRFHAPDVESQVQPTSTGSTGQGSDAVQGRVYTKAEINLFYDNYAKGLYPFSVGDIQVFSEEDGVRIDNDMTRANMEGRIVG